MQKITFDITKNPKTNEIGVKIDSDGFKGVTCLTELEKYKAFMQKEYGIDIQVIDQQKKPAAYVPAGNEQNKTGVI